MTVSSSIGPASGIDYGKLIDGLTGLMQKPIDQLGTRLDTLGKQSDALFSLSTLMVGLKISAASFTSAGVFKAATATSGNPSVLTATAGLGTTTGNYAFNVQRLASASQQVTQGFADSTSALGLAGTIKLQLGGGRLDDVAKLSALNGGAGVARGAIRVTDRSGASTLIDLSHAVDVNDVVNTINSATGVNVIAKLDGDRLVLSDNTGGAGNLVVTDAGGTSTATDLGLTAASVAGVLTGTSITKLKATTSLQSLNDGLGVRNAGILDDFSITGTTGTANVSLNGAKTLNDVITNINAKTTNTGVSAAISTDGHGITLTDSGAGAITVTALAGSLAAKDLGIVGSGTGTLVGERIASGLSGPLLTNLKGGEQGQVGRTAPTFGTITINAQTIDLSSARTLDDALKTFNTNSQGVTASINNAGTGITLTSTSASFTIADGTGNLASYLGIAGASTSTATGSQIQSGDERLRYISDNTRLSTLNGGAGVKLGLIRLTAPPLSGGSTTTLNVDLSKAATIGDVVSKINQSGLAITARINDTGDGILLTQTSGTTQAKIEEVNGGSTAKDLGILGTFATNKLDGSFQKSITLVATDTLADFAKKVNDLGAGISASVINDGSGNTPFRLNLASRNSGVAGRLILDGSSAGIDTTSLVQGQDAVLVYGGDATGKGGLVATNSNNTFTGIVPGLTLTLAGVGSSTVTVNRDDSKIKDSISGFVDAYNKIVDNIDEVTKFDTTDQTKNGVLFANPTVQQVQDALGLFVGKAYSAAGKYKTLASVGISIGQDGKLTLDSDKLSTALAANPDDVRNLFTTNIKAVAGGAHSISTKTLLSSLASTSFPAGHIKITDGFGTAHDIDLSTGVSTIGDVISKINAGTANTVTAGINITGDGILLTQVGGLGTAQVDEVNGATTAAALNIKGTFVNGALNGALLPVLPSGAVKGVGGTLSDLLDRFTNGQTGIIFKSTDAIGTQETQIKDRQTALATLLIAKKNRLIRQFANLEVTISQLQSQGTALSNFKGITTSK